MPELAAEKASTIVLNSKQQVAPLGIIASVGAQDLGNKINNYLVEWSKNTPYAQPSYLVDADTPRFSSGLNQRRRYFHYR